MRMSQGIVHKENVFRSYIRMTQGIVHKDFFQVIHENGLGHCSQGKHFFRLQMGMTQGFVHNKNTFQIKDEIDLGHCSQEKPFFQIRDENNL